MMQITNIRYHDNGSPQAALPDFIRRCNATDPAVKLRFVTISDFFDRLRAEPEERLPLMRGDWTDWWNFGSGSTAHETAQAARRPAPSRRRARPRRLAPERRGERPRAASRHGAAVARALRRAHLGRRPLDPRAALAGDAHAASPEARPTRRRARASRACSAATASNGSRDRRRRRGAAAPRLQPAPVPGAPVAPPALSAAARRCARAATGHRHRDLRADRPEFAPHPAAGRGDRRHCPTTTPSGAQPIEVPALSYVTIPATDVRLGARRR